MRRYLIVANRTLGGDHLLEMMRAAIAEDDDCAFHVVVPASADPTSWTSDLERDQELARVRLGEALERFGDLGVEVSGEVGDPRPDDAVLDVLRRGETFDEIIVSTLPPGLSRWLHLDLVSRVRRAVDMPVRHVIAAEDVQPV